MKYFQVFFLTAGTVAAGFVFTAVVGLTWAGKPIRQIDSQASKIQVMGWFQAVIFSVFLSLIIISINKLNKNLQIYELSIIGVIAPWSGRFYSLWDTGYAKIHIPIIASVSEHQPTTWFSFFFDLHVLACVFPVGLW